MGEKRGREGWREKGGGRGGHEEPKVRGDTGEMERRPSFVMVAGPPRASAPALNPGPPHLPIRPPSWSPATFHSPHPPPPKGKKNKKKRDGKKENKISTVVETRGEK